MWKQNAKNNNVPKSYWRMSGSDLTNLQSAIKFWLSWYILKVSQCSNTFPWMKKNVFWFFSLKCQWNQDQNTNRYNSVIHIQYVFSNSFLSSFTTLSGSFYCLLIFGRQYTKVQHAINIMKPGDLQFFSLWIIGDYFIACYISFPFKNVIASYS